MDNNEKIIKAIETLKREHRYCEDTWYSCPKHPKGCANEFAGDECDCGADEQNKVIDEIITELKRVYQGPVAWIVHEDGVRGLRWSHPRNGMLKVEPLYTTPPAPAQPLTGQQIYNHYRDRMADTGQLLAFTDGVRFAEAAHGITK